MSRILITGRGSFIGSNFRRFSEYCDVTEVSLRGIDPARINFKGYDVVIHLAAIVHQSNKRVFEEYFKINRDLALTVASLSREAGVKQFIFLSTVKVYGPWINGSEPWNEESPCFPDDPYGKSKYEAEIGLKEIETKDFVVSIVRTPIVYGPGVGANIFKLIRLIETFPILPLYGINNNRQYTYVENLFVLIDIIIEIKASGVFILMDEKPLSTSELVRLISGCMNKKPVFFRMPDILIKAGVLVKPAIFDKLYRSFYLDNSKTKKILGFSPAYTIDEGLCIMVKAYLADKKTI